MGFKNMKRKKIFCQLIDNRLNSRSHHALLIICIIGLTVSTYLAGEETRPVVATSQATVTTITDSKSMLSARQIAEKYWNAQKLADEKAFREVTAHDAMRVVFDWFYVNQSEITVEKDAVTPIKDELAACINLRARYVALPIFSSERLPIVQEIASHADRIAKRSPMLAEFLKKGYWEIITPNTFPEAKTYQLMHYDFIVNVEFQSKGGTTLKKRITTNLRRLIVDSYDSGWKVFFIPGI